MRAFFWRHLIHQPITFNWSKTIAANANKQLKNLSTQVSLIRLALRLFTFRYTSVPSKILWKSCLRNSFFFPLIAESQLRKVRESKQPAYKIFGKQTFAQFFFLHKVLVMRHQLLSGYFGLYPPSLSDKSGGEKSLFLLKMATLVTSVNWWGHCFLSNSDEKKRCRSSS